jgi:hypothetical protein
LSGTLRPAVIVVLLSQSLPLCRLATFVAGSYGALAGCDV